MLEEYNKYKEENLITFSVHVEQNENYKKSISFPKNWQKNTLETSKYDQEFNSLAILTGSVNNIVVLDINNVEEWEQLLKEENQKDPATVKAITGTGGYHYYFKYTDDLKNVTSKDNVIKNYSIDIKSNDECVICPPSKYYSNKLKKEVEYIWKYNIFDYEMIEMPEWIKRLLLEKHKKQSDEKNEDANMKYTDDDFEILLTMLNETRCENHDDWIKVGMILKNINNDYKYLWKRWSKQSEKHDENECEEKWKSFKKEKKYLSIDRLLYWCKDDNKEEYEKFIKTKKIHDIIISKFPNVNLIFGDRIMNGQYCLIELKNKTCLIKGCKHIDFECSMYLEILEKHMTIKCKHPECFGKIYLSEHILMNEQEMNNVFNRNVPINNNNNEFIEFQKINLYDDPKINKSIFNSLNGEPYSLAKIVYYLYPDKFNYGENNNWYVYENHKWRNTGVKNPILRDRVQEKLKEIYLKLIKYYQENGYDIIQIQKLKKIKKSIDNTNMKNNIMTELSEIYSVNNNCNRDFVKKLNTNNNLLGFNNGVYDLSKLEFREGKPNDYISISTSYDYIANHTEYHKDLIQFLEDIQPNQEEREYMLTYLSIALIGNILELFTILTGNGRNGKSKLIELLNKTFESYFGAVPSQLFTRPRPNANSPDPGLLSLAKKKLVVAAEPEKNSKLNSGFIKFITGRDSVTLRNCHSNKMINFSPKFITLLICNDIPECDDMDNALSKRLRCINFPTEFVDNPIKKNQKKIDTNIDEKFNLWKQDFMLLLIEYYKKYLKSNILKTTNNILKWTNKYKEDTDVYLQFLNECTKTSDSNIKSSILYDSFKTWFKNNNPNSKIPNNRNFYSGIKKYKTVEHVKVEGVTCYGIKNLELCNQFVENESDIHKNAKELCKELFSDYEVILEYPLYYADDTNSIDTIPNEILSFEQCKKKGYYPKCILDVALIKNKKLICGIEIHHTNITKNKKINDITEMINKSKNKIHVYEISTTDIKNISPTDILSDRFKIV
jgi:P4 family phage/plasmid primase-like protien